MGDDATSHTLAGSLASDVLRLAGRRSWLQPQLESRV